MHALQRTAQMGLLCAFLPVLLTGCGAQPSGPTDASGGAQLDAETVSYISDIQLIEKGDILLVLNTEKGRIAIELRDTKAPITTRAIEKLVQQHFYDGLSFHRVERNFLIQTGDPTGGTATSTGTPTIPFEETGDLNNRVRGAVGMARAEDDRDSADSQFYILLAPRPSLDHRYAVFGQVVKGLEIADTIARGDHISRAVLVANLPAAPVTATPRSASGITATLPELPGQ